MNQKAVFKARYKLNEARFYANQLRDDLSFPAFMRMAPFIVILKNIYVTIEISVKGNAKAYHWWGRIKEEIKGDELINYLLKSRDVDEHGVEEIVFSMPGYLRAGSSRPGTSQHIKFDLIDGRPQITSMDGLPVDIDYQPSLIKLHAVHHCGRIYQPPTIHCGEQIKTNHPSQIAALAVAYYEGLVVNAEHFLAEFNQNQT